MKKIIILIAFLISFANSFLLDVGYKGNWSLASSSGPTAEYDYTFYDGMHGFFGRIGSGVFYEYSKTFGNLSASGLSVFDSKIEGKVNSSTHGIGFLTQGDAIIFGGSFGIEIENFQSIDYYAPYLRLNVGFAIQYDKHVGSGLASDIEVFLSTNRIAVGLNIYFHINTDDVYIEPTYNNNLTPTERVILINEIFNTTNEYKTMCKDGTFSKSTGRGTCSHHGGISR